ncbi:MAG: molecular chaperone DnaJ [Proteobacteria bacterium]|nr:molecular chaperone DnaJ [Pseudomonadota bacterium]
MHPFIILVALLTVVLAIKWVSRLPASQRTQARNRVLLYGGLGLLAVLLITGRLHPLFAGLAALIPLARRLMSFAQMANTFNSFRKRATGSQGPAPGQTSDVETRFLRMSLDHDSGDLDGIVLEGPHEGRRLSELKLENLLELLASYRREDPKSAAVLEAYLERAHGDSWRGRDDSSDNGRAIGGGGVQGMDLAEARQILDVKADATREDIIEAHRSLMQKMHPDRGGSNFLAAKINQAKTTLLDA